MTLFGYTVSALAPWLLLGIPLAAGILIAIYRARGSTQEVVISTLMLVRELPELLTARKRFSPPLQFWIELAALVLLSLAAAGIYAAESGERIAVVVDTSLSMSAKDSSGAPRLETALRLASADVAQRIGRARFSVYSAGATLRRVSESEVSSSEAVSSLRSITPTLTPDALEGALRSLIADGSFDSVWVYTDKSLAEGAPAAANFRLTTVPSDGSRTHNVWVRSLTARSTDSLTVDLASIGPSQATARIVADCFGKDGVPTRDQPGVTVQLPPGRTVTTTLGPLKEQWSYCSVSVKGLSGGDDALLVDNVAWITQSGGDSVVQVISPLSVEELGLKRISGYSFVKLPSSSDPQFQKGSPTIFHRSPVPESMQGPILSILPPAGRLPWGGLVSTPSSGSVALTRWEPSHPILQYTNPTLISLPTAQAITCPELSQSILTSSVGSLVCAGEGVQGGYLVVGFEIFPFDGLASPTVSIFTLNALKWLMTKSTGGDVAGGVGTIALPQDARGVRYLAPSAPPPELSVGNTATLSTPGVISFTSSDSPQPTLKAVNVFSHEESDLSDIELLPSDIAATPSRANPRSPLSFAPWLALVALLVLFLDLARRIRLKTTWGVR